MMKLSLSKTQFTFISTLIVAASCFANTSFKNPSNHPSKQNGEKSTALRIELPVEKFQLKNGLTVLLLLDKRVPLVSVHTWYKVGSINESEGVTGAAHMLEHMMFKGAKRYTGEEFDKTLHSMGGVNNAFTTHDYTGFYESIPSQHLEKMLDIESDRMMNIAIKTEALLPEREVVKEERRWRIENNPNGFLYQATYEKLFSGTPYGWPVIGHMKDISEYTSEKLRFFHDNFYGPNNAVLVIVGDFDPEKTKSWIQKYYESIPARKVPENSVSSIRQSIDDWQKKSSLKKSDVSIFEKEVQTDTFQISFPSVPNGHPDMYALDLLSHILGGSNSSRLYLNLVYKDRDCSIINSWNSTQKYVGVFAVTGFLMAGKDSKRVLEKVRSNIEKLKSGNITEEELKRAKIAVMKAATDRLMTADQKARALAEYEIIYGDYKRMTEELNYYDQVNLADLKRVAKKYLDTKFESTVILKPISKK